MLRMSRLRLGLGGTLRTKLATDEFQISRCSRATDTYVALLRVVEVGSMVEIIGQVGIVTGYIAGPQSRSLKGPLGMAVRHTVNLGRIGEIVLLVVVRKATGPKKTEWEGMGALTPRPCCEWDRATQRRLRRRAGH